MDVLVVMTLLSLVGGGTLIFAWFKSPSLQVHPGFVNTAVANHCNTQRSSAVLGRPPPDPCGESAMWKERCAYLPLCSRFIVVVITMCDFMISLKFLVGALAWKTSTVKKGKMVHSSFRLFDDGCVVEALFAQFFFMATICWNLVWVFNFTLELYNPLRRTKSLAKWYHLFVWTLSVGSAIAVGSAKLYGCVLRVRVPTGCPAHMLGRCM